MIFRIKGLINCNSEHVVNYKIYVVFLQKKENEKRSFTSKFGFTR